MYLECSKNKETALNEKVCKNVWLAMHMYSKATKAKAQFNVANIIG